jgi:hypothetical protein
MPCCFRNELGASTVTFDLASLGTGTFTDLVAVVVNQTNTEGIPGEPETGISGAGFSDFTSGFLILWTEDPAFASWDLSVNAGEWVAISRHSFMLRPPCEMWLRSPALVVN